MLYIPRLNINNLNNFSKKQKSLSRNNHIGFRSEHHPKICVYVSNMYTHTFLTFEIPFMLLSSCHWCGIIVLK
jgi:hypothetical protein